MRAGGFIPPDGSTEFAARLSSPKSEVRRDKPGGSLTERCSTRRRLWHAERPPQADGIDTAHNLHHLTSNLGAEFRLARFCRDRSCRVNRATLQIPDYWRRND